MRKDIDFNFIPHPITGDLSTKRDRNAINQSIKNLVLTNYYERGFNIDISGNLTDLLFDNYTELTKSTIEKNLTNLLNNFEPGVEVVEIIVVPQVDDNLIEVNIVYTYYNNPETQIVSIPVNRIR